MIFTILLHVTGRTWPGQHPPMQRWSSADAILDTQPPGYTACEMLTMPASSRSHTKGFRNPVAITSSDYYSSSRKPQVDVPVRPYPSVPLLDTPFENEPARDFQSPSMFRYTPTPIVDPARQSVPTSLSRPSTSQNVESHSNTPQAIQQNLNAPLIVGGMTPQPRALSPNEATGDQFIPLVIMNPETGKAYEFRDGYYVPISAAEVSQPLPQIFNDTAIEAPAPVSGTSYIATT